MAVRETREFISSAGGVRLLHFIFTTFYAQAYFAVCDLITHTSSSDNTLISCIVLNTNGSL